MRILRRLLIFLWIAGLLSGATFYQIHEQALLAPMPLHKAEKFEVPAGATLDWVAGKLAARGWLQSPPFLHLYARLGGQAEQLKAGRYLLTPGMSVWQAILRFNQGKVLQSAFTIVEGRRFKELLLALRHSEKVKWTLEGLSAKQIMAILGRPDVAAEGMFFADTYKFPDGTTDRQLLKRAMLTLDQKLAQEWAGRAKDLPLENAYQALILASIIEKETAVAQERALISGVFIRRLRKGMRLQTDPTVIYGLGEHYDGNLRRRDLRTDTAYNTYTRFGLPPTPIAMIGLDALHAALHPDKGEAMYFVARGDGHHYFSKNYAEHQQAVNRYQRKLKPRQKKTGGGNN